MKTQTTPGPWKVSPDNEGFAIEPATRQRGCSYVAILESRGTNDTGTMESNARLIAAAPELLDALRWFATCAEPEDDGTLSRKDLEHASKRASEVLAKLKDITL